MAETGSPNESGKEGRHDDNFGIVGDSEGGMHEHAPEQATQAPESDHVTRSAILRMLCSVWSKLCAAVQPRPRLRRRRRSSYDSSIPVIVERLPARFDDRTTEAANAEEADKLARERAEFASATEGHNHMPIDLSNTGKEVLHGSIEVSGNSVTDSFGMPNVETFPEVDGPEQK